MAADDPSSQRDRKDLVDKFTQLRPEVLETLRALLSEHSVLSSLTEFLL